MSDESKGAIEDGCSFSVGLTVGKEERGVGRICCTSAGGGEEGEGEDLGAQFGGEAEEVERLGEVRGNGGRGHGGGQWQVVVVDGRG